MYILMIARGIPSAENPQWGCFEKDLAEALVAIGNKVIVACIDKRFLLQHRKVGISQTTINDIPYFNSFIIPTAITDLVGRKFSQRMVGDTQMRHLYNRIVKKYGKPDIILGEFCYCTANGVCIAQKENIPLVGIEHLANFNDEKLVPRVKWFGEYAYKYTNNIISVSENLKEGLLHHLHKESIVINNCVSKDFIINDTAKKPNDTFEFVACGKLEIRKGFDLLIEVLSEDEFKNIPWRLQIIGEGEYRSTLEKLIQSKNMGHKILLVGQKTKEEIRAIYLNSHAFMMPSRQENFSVAILEALVLGLPTISSDCGGATQCIDSASGIIFKTNNIQDLRNALRKYFTTYKSFNNEQIAHNCRDKYSPEVIATQITQVLENTKQQYHATNH